MAKPKGDRQDKWADRGAPDAQIDDAPLAPEFVAMRAELAELAHAVTTISEQLNQDCATARMVMKASRLGRGDRLAVEPILSASAYYAVADLDRIYPRIGATIRTLRALAEKYGS